MFYLVIAIIAEIIGTSAMKASNGLTHPVASVIAAVGFIVAFACLALALKTIPVGIAYAIWSGVGIIAISLIGYFVFKQNLDLPAVLGILMIIAGVLVINTLSSSV